MITRVLGSAVAALHIGAAARVLAYELALRHGAGGFIALPVALRLVAYGLANGFWGVACC